MNIKNPRWDGVPFIMKAGKALNERKAEVNCSIYGAPAAVAKQLSCSEEDEPISVPTQHAVTHGDVVHNIRLDLTDALVGYAYT
ncbi:hypothetical protein H257_19425 [Aphanomyces astaci]|uniref:Glucose-6-phosphate dehydrogenase C-terminal domain-containing protein n=1 Tax=Aphanomyces astaci TaxID=112090 RepID=W4F851_APHAT|nr:hypothetical protein H257_19425 [Aphanomyces astaci]ETV63645.1 hypothetical protein H257_19425 [Aphanomyces astaci]|eukprot:XP_009846872.1 hypothetical protein H257_19425 [Aphanomyces astaci]